MTIAKGEDFGKWYQELVVKSEMIEYSDISGAGVNPIPWLGAGTRQLCWRMTLCLVAERLSCVPSCGNLYVVGRPEARDASADRTMQTDMHQI